MEERIGMAAVVVWPVALGLLIVVEAILAMMSLYLLSLAGASLFARLPRKSPPPKTRFGVLIPAHNEELLLGTLLRSLQELDYPAKLYDVHVVADNCSDATCDIARAAGVNVHERIDPSAPGKGRALNWLIHSLLGLGATQGAYDAFVILDADSVVSPNFLSEMNAQMCAGNLVVQSFNDISNPVESWAASLRYMAFCLICYLRPLGRTALGLSVGLFGNGMCLACSLFDRFRWDPGSSAEDGEFHLQLLRAGHKVVFAPHAHVYSQMATSLGVAWSQNVRWERGKLELMRRLSGPLLAEGFRSRNWCMIDGALQPIIPPLSLAFGLAFVCLAFSLVLESRLALALALLILAAQGLYILRGLTLMPVQSPRLYLALLYVPWFIVWKVRVYLAIACGAGKGQWIRTARAHRD